MTSKIISNTAPEAVFNNKISEYKQAPKPLPKETKDFFLKQAETLAKGIVNTLAEEVSVKEDKGWSSYLPSWPSWLSYKSTGKAAGFMAGMTHGQAVLNQGIDIVAQKALQNSLGTWGSKGAAEGIKIAANAWLGPYLPALFSFAGGAAGGILGSLLGAGSAYLISLLIKQNDPETLAMMSQEEINAFLNENKEQIDQALIKLGSFIIAQNTFSRLQECKTNDEVASILKEFVTHREPVPGAKKQQEKIVLADGYVLNASQKATYESIIENFDQKMFNFGQTAFNKKDLKEIISLFAIHKANAASQEAKERRIEEVVIQCTDGYYCGPKGEAVDQEEAKNLFELTKELNRLLKIQEMQAEEAELEKESSDFEMIQPPA